MVKPWSRVATSLTGRLSFFAAKATSPVRGVNCALEPNAPPTNGLTTCTLSGSDAELLGDAVLQAVHELARLVDRQLAVAPRRRGGEQLDRVVMLGRRAVFGFELDLGRSEGGLGVAGLRQILGASRLTLLASSSVTPGESNVALGFSAL